MIMVCMIFNSIRFTHPCISTSSNMQKLDLVKMTYSVTKLGGAIDWKMQRNNYLKSIAISHRHHGGKNISVRSSYGGDDDSYDGGVDDTLDGVVYDVEKDISVQGGALTAAGNDDAYSGGIDDTLGIISSPINSAAGGNDDAYGGNMDDTLDFAEEVSEVSKTTTESAGNDDAYDREVDDTLLDATPIKAVAASNRHANDEEENNEQPYLRVDRHRRHRRLQESNIDGDVFDGYEYDQGACPNAGSLDVPCAPSNLSSICNKYDRDNGSFKECLEACKPAFCCIHDAPRESNYLSPNCNTDENCPQYNYCYIVWWKLHDTVGPAMAMRLDQDDEFYEGAQDEIDAESSNTDPFMTQLLLHHFDDIDQVIEDGTENDDFDAERIFLNEKYWMYPEVTKVDIND